MTRDEAIAKAVGAIADEVRAFFNLRLSELWIEWAMVGEDVELQVRVQGLGVSVQDDEQFDTKLAKLREDHADVLDGERWEASVGQRQYLAEMPEKDFAARMREKVRR